MRRLPAYLNQNPLVYIGGQYNGGAYLPFHYSMEPLTARDVEMANATPAQATITDAKNAAAPTGDGAINFGIRPIPLAFIASATPTPILQDVSGPLQRTYLSIQWNINNTAPLMIGFGGVGPYEVQPGETWYPAGIKVPQNSLWVYSATAANFSGVILQEITSKGGE